MPAVLSAVIALGFKLNERPPQSLYTTEAGYNEQHIAWPVVAADTGVQQPVVVELLPEHVAGLGAPVPLKDTVHRPSGNIAGTPRVRSQNPGVLIRFAASLEKCHDVTPISRARQLSGDQIGDEPVGLKPMRQLRVRGPVIATLPTKLLAVDTPGRSDQDRAGLVEQPVRLRLPRPNGDSG